MESTDGITDASHARFGFRQFARAFVGAQQIAALRKSWKLTAGAADRMRFALALITLGRQ
jgi:hypothetical protein